MKAPILVAALLVAGNAWGQDIPAESCEVRAHPKGSDRGDIYFGGCPYFTDTHTITEYRTTKNWDQSECNWDCEGEDGDVCVSRTCPPGPQYTHEQRTITVPARIGEWEEQP